MYVYCLDDVRIRASILRSIYPDEQEGWGGVIRGGGGRTIGIRIHRQTINNDQIICSPYAVQGLRIKMYTTSFIFYPMSCLS